MDREKKAKKQSSFKLMIKRLFGIGSKEMSLMEEEQMQSPMRTVVRNFMANKLSMGGLIVFFLIFLLVLIGPMISPVDLAYHEGTQKNIAPGMNMMKVPSGLKNNAASLSSGSAFGVGADKNGKVYTWGQTKISKTINIKNMPADMDKIVKTSAGYDHALALAEDGTVYGWGSNRFKQAEVPEEVYQHGRIIDIATGFQLSAAVSEDGYVTFWGNESTNDVRVKKKSQQGNNSKVVMTATSMYGLTKDGEVLHFGKQEDRISMVPEEVQGRAVDLAASATALAAVLDDGSVRVWGNMLKGENNVPQMNGRVVSIAAGRYHFTALTDTGEVYSWGLGSLGQTDVPDSVQGKAKEIYAGYYQNYAVLDNGAIKTWGLRGYFLGSDDLGRDVLQRLINGGRMTMTVGAIAVVISTIIGVMIGGISGFFGGKIDIILQRITEVFSAMPFLPFAMILSAIIGNQLPENMRIYLIMIVLGVLTWPPLCRLVRAQVLAEREQEFVTAARAMGVKQLAIVFKHIIPNVISVIIVSATLDFATCMLTEATLSYLGFGVQLPRPTWGNMLYGCNDSIVIQNYWWRWVFAAILLSICVICINMVGDGLRDAIDPKSNER